jgi:hypothetical protein
MSPHTQLAAAVLGAAADHAAFLGYVQRILRDRADAAEARP